MLTEMIIPNDCNSVGKQIVELGLPKTTLISIIQRDNKFITPNGSTILEPNDKLFILSENKEDLNEVFNCLDMKTPELVPGTEDYVL
jgi:cell volume regulation protein A